MSTFQRGAYDFYVEAVRLRAQPYGYYGRLSSERANKNVSYFQLLCRLQSALTVIVDSKGRSYIEKHYLAADVKKFEVAYASLPTDEDKMAFVIQAVETVIAKLEVSQIFRWQLVLSSVFDERSDGQFSSAMKGWQSSQEESRLTELVILKAARYEE